MRKYRAQAFLKVLFTPLPKDCKARNKLLSPSEAKSGLSISFGLGKYYRNSRRSSVSCDGGAIENILRRAFPLDGGYSSEQKNYLDAADFFIQKKAIARRPLFY